MPYCATWKIAALGSVLMATMQREPRIPVTCWIVRRYRGGETWGRRFSRDADRVRIGSQPRVATRRRRPASGRAPPGADERQVYAADALPAATTTSAAPRSGSASGRGSGRGQVARGAVIEPIVTGPAGGPAVRPREPIPSPVRPRTFRTRCLETALRVSESARRSPRQA